LVIPRGPTSGLTRSLIVRHYRELVLAMDAEKWFGITPASVGAAKAARESGAEGKIVKLPGVKAA
jgi:hypothetical protein